MIPPLIHRKVTRWAFFSTNCKVITMRRGLDGVSHASVFVSDWPPRHVYLEVSVTVFSGDYLGLSPDCTRWWSQKSKSIGRVHFYSWFRFLWHFPTPVIWMALEGQRMHPYLGVSSTGYRWTYFWAIVQEDGHCWCLCKKISKSLKTSSYSMLAVTLYCNYFSYKTQN